MRTLNYQMMGDMALHFVPMGTKCRALIGEKYSKPNGVVSILFSTREIFSLLDGRN